jgi:hypothetical protein
MKSRWILSTVIGLGLMAFPLVVAAQMTDGADIGALRKIMEKQQGHQATIQRLETNREAFIADIVDAWSATASSRGYDLSAWRQDLTTALRPLTAEKLVAASEVSNYGQLVSLLTGAKLKSSSEESPGIRPLSLGDDATDLVYFPVEPCRIFNTLAGTGTFGTPLTPATPRAYSHNIGLAAQGGNPAGCGIPTDPAAIAITLTVVVPSGPGDIRAWPLLSPVPLASVVNYTNVSGLNIANTTILPTCQVCGNDFNVQADVSGTHLIGDVVGYFWSPNATELDNDLIRSAFTTAAASSSFNIFSPACAAGYRLTGGGFQWGEFDPGNVIVVASRPESLGTNTSSRWLAQGTNRTLVGHDISVWAVCSRVPGR